MTNYGGALRRARAEVMPHIPELASQLRYDRKIILHALAAKLIEAGHDPDEVSRADWNKAERYTIASYVIRQHADFLVEGTGSDARFTNFLANKKGERQGRAFRKDIKATQAHGAKHIARLYSSKIEDSEPWYPAAADRYRQLGKVAFFRWWRRVGGKIKIGPHVPLEGLALHFALRTDALPSVAHAYVEDIPAMTRDLPKEEQRQAAHDLTSPAVSIAGVHFIEFSHQVFNIGDEVAKDEQSGHYYAVYNRTKRRHHVRLPHLPTTRLKCPAHTKQNNPETGRWDDSALQDMFHASINAAFEFGYYGL